ncbi:MAG: DNA replication/repair protein RecF [Flavobacteriaceae bacterium]|nr:DNA replication/repair protein RecF [Flavobacteriaceae bacterium]
MFLQRLHFVNFKNFEENSFEFSPKINAFVGNNGKGKTNILDAVYYLSFLKSYFNHQDKQNIRFEQNFFMIEGWFQKDKKEEHVLISVHTEQKKLAKRNEKTYDRLSDHLGKFPVVIISPYDRDLITEGSDTRRRFIDSIIAQSDSVYLAELIRYNKVLLQRNALLKFFAANRVFDAIQLDIFDHEIMKIGEYIFQQRQKFIKNFKPIFQKYYNFISTEKEIVEISYTSDLKNNELSYLKDNLSKDRLLQYTSAGVHKDDLKFKINAHPIKKFGSQGQQKSYLIALKLAQLEIIKNQLKITPLLLLDDIFDKLDESRVEQIIKLVNEEHFGQIFLSDTHPERTRMMLEKINEDHQIFQL